MSGMAEEIISRINADSDGAGAAPGTDGGTPPAPSTPSAGTSNTDAGGPPETIPYARFKEVNDSYQQLKGFEELAQYGYDPDSLGRLAAFEAQYMTDPVGTWMSLSKDLDLPQEVKDALEAHLSGDQASTDPSPTSGAAPESGNAPTASLPPEVQETLRWVEERRRQEAEAAQANTVDEVLNSIKGHWDALDQADGINTPENVKYTFISAAAARGGFKTPQEVAEAARSELLAYRDQELGAVVQGSSRSGSPLAVPGGVPAAPTPQKFGGLRDASRQAIADLQAGRIPSS